MRTHLELANWLGLPLAVVAVVREVQAGTSAHAQRALEKCGDEPAEAAVWLAQFRQRYQVAELITPAVVQQITAADGV